MKGKYIQWVGASILASVFAVLLSGVVVAGGRGANPVPSYDPEPVLVFIPDFMRSPFQQGPINFAPEFLAPIYLEADPSVNPLLVQMASGVKGKWHAFPSPVAALNLDSLLVGAVASVMPREGPGRDRRAAPYLRPPSPAVVEHGSRSRKRVALTFDACSDFRLPKLDGRVLRHLAEMNVPATVFVGGRWADRAPDLVRTLASTPGVEIGNHSYSHPRMTRVSNRKLVEEIQWTQDVLYRITGRVPRLFRAPFGEVDDRLAQGAATLGLRTIQFDVESGDPDPRVTRERMVSWVLRSVRNGSIVVMHINRKGHYTADALPELVKTLRRRGFELVTVSELLEG